MKGYRYPLDSLHQVNRQLADALEKISVQLEQLALSSQSGLNDHDRPNLEVQMQRNHILSAEWEKIIGQIREIDGFCNFYKLLHSLLFEQLLWRALSLGNDTGNPGVSPGLPLPVPQKTCTHECGYGFYMGMGQGLCGFDGSKKPMGTRCTG